jgi:hypothetical protein
MKETVYNYVYTTIQSLGFANAHDRRAFRRTFRFTSEVRVSKKHLSW